MAWTNFLSVWNKNKAIIIYVRLKMNGSIFLCKHELGAFYSEDNYEKIIKI